MAKNEGYISVHRCIFNNWIWKDKPFSKGQAWIDLLLLATRQDGTLLHKGELVEYKRGQVCRSISWLADRWGWSRHKVSDFLDLLEKDSMLHQDRTVKRTVITIENYTLYQDGGTAKRTDDVTDLGHTSDTYNNNNIYIDSLISSSNNNNTNLKDKLNNTNISSKNNIYIQKTNKTNISIQSSKLNKTNNKYKNIDISNIEGESEELRNAIKDFIDHRIEINASMKQQAYKRFITTLGKLASTDEEKIMIIDQSIFYGWKGVFKVKDEYRVIMASKPAIEFENGVDPLEEVFARAEGRWKE